LGLFDEAILEVVKAHCPEGAFCEIENFVARGRPLARDQAIWL
jgi:hypothetical protein